MDVILFSDSAGTRTLLEKVGRSRSISLSYAPCVSLKKIIKDTGRDAFVYVDIGCFDEEERESVLRYLKNYGNRRYGVIDPEGWVDDAGALILEGAGDYVGPQITTALTVDRVRRAAALHPVPMKDAGRRRLEAVRTGYTLSGSDWDRIRPGREYTFILMYVSLHGKEALKRHLSDDLVADADAEFRSYIESAVTRSGGRIWIWNDFEGVVLFGFDGTECPAVLLGINMMLSETVYSVENRHFNVPLTFRIALHLGNTVYRRYGETGTLVSDSINTVFNLGRKYGSTGGFYCTRQVFEFFPSGVESCFVGEGRFEEFEIMRMRRVLLPASERDAT